MWYNKNRGFANILLVYSIFLLNCIITVKAKEENEETTTQDPSNLLTAFLGAVLMIICSELGDKTFVIAALLSMKCRNTKSKSLKKSENIYGREIDVFLGCSMALVIMTVLATACGIVIPLIISKEKCSFLTCILFFTFGLKMFHEAYHMTEDHDTIEDMDTLKPPEYAKSFRFIHKLLCPAALHAFVLTILAEWGDRSQIATFALAAEHGALSVSAGAICGHLLCTALAVIGGKVLADRISERVVLLIGGCFFLLFSIVSVYQMIHV